MKVLVIVCKMPLISLHERVILCSPGARPWGGVQLQSPEELTSVVEEMGFSDSTKIVISVPSGPLPKNWGLVEVMVSFSSTLSSVTFEASVVEVSASDKLNFDSWVAISPEASMFETGSSSSVLAGRFL
jgi:hypothetical protein